MPVSTLAQILIRLYALNALISGFIELISVSSNHHNGFLEFGYLNLFPGVIYMLTGVVFWRFSHWGAHFLTGRMDTTITLAGVSEATLYGVAILSMGLYFALSSFASTFNWFHYLVISRSSIQGIQLNNAPSFYSLAESGMKLAAGLYLTVTAKRWGLRLSTPKTSSAPEIR